jgi:voltage-gated sodium channel
MAAEPGAGGNRVAASTPAVARATRARVAAWMESPPVQRAIIGLVIANAVTLGLETVPAAMSRFGGALLLVDRALLGIFVVELAIKLAAQGRSFFRSGWNTFDLAVVAIALVPAAGTLSVLRALRVLRILRVVSAVPKLRFMIEALARSIPGIGSIALLLGLFFYVFAVMATKLYGDEVPQRFGSLGLSLYSLFEVMTLEGWSEIAREVMAHSPSAWVFFVLFILLATFTVLNLFIGMIVKAMEESPSAQEMQHEIAAEIRAMRAELWRLRVRSAPQDQGHRGAAPGR